MAKNMITGNLAEILTKIIYFSNGDGQIEEASDEDYKSEDYLEHNGFKPINLRRSDRTPIIEVEDDDEIVQEANKYVIEQLGKQIKERVIEDLVSKFLRVKFKSNPKENVQKGEIQSKFKSPRYYNKEKPVVRHYKNFKNSVEISKENQEMKVTGKSFAKNFKNDASDLLLKRKQPKENKPTPHSDNGFKRPRYVVKERIRNKQEKGNEIFVILQPKLESTEKENDEGSVTHSEQNIKEKRLKSIASTSTTVKNRFIKKTRKERISEKSNKGKETISPKRPSGSGKTQQEDLIFERIKLNTNYKDSNEHSSNLEKDERVKDQDDSKPQSNKVKRLKIKKNRDDAKIREVEEISKESDIVKAVTSYLWIDDDKDDTEQERTTEPDERESQESESTLKDQRTTESKKVRFKTTPYNYESSPSVAERYDFNEPLPERDRVREVIKPIWKPPSRINKKQKAK